MGRPFNRAGEEQKEKTRYMIQEAKMPKMH